MIGKRKTWKQATEDAIVRVCRRRGTTTFDFNSLVTQELPQILEEVQSRGATPEQSLSKFLHSYMSPIDFQNTTYVGLTSHQSDLYLYSPFSKKYA